MLTNIKSAVSRLKRNEKGVTAIEYGLIAVAVAVLVVAVFYSDSGFIKKLQGKFDTLTTQVEGAKLDTGAGGDEDKPNP